MAHETLLICNDLIFSSKIIGTAKALEVPARAVPSVSAALSAIGSETGMLLVDLASPASTTRDDLAELRGKLPSTSTLVAYGSHVEAERLRQAREAGCDLVLTRSQLVEQLVSLLQGEDSGTRDTPSG